MGVCVPGGPRPEIALACHLATGATFWTSARGPWPGPTPRSVVGRTRVHNQIHHMVLVRTPVKYGAAAARARCSAQLRGSSLYGASHRVGAAPPSLENLERYGAAGSGPGTRPE